MDAPVDQARDQSRVVRVFVCSTFRDFADERDLLMKRVFPELRRRARERFVEVIGVDLRWGITEEESQRGETLAICLREIERSRPYFIGLVGERYGWTPPADRYPEQLLARQPWLAEHAGGTSVTELEILHGVLNDPGSAARARFYFRDPVWAEGRGDDFRSENEDERRKLARLKERIRASGCPVTDYPDPAGAADRITEDLWRLIDAEYPAGEVPDELERERRKHAAYAAERRRIYVGQEDTVARLLARIEEASDAPGVDGSRSRITVVTGESGIGKSALIANVSNAWRSRHPGDFVLEYYFGSSPDAADHLHFMRRACEEIRRRTGSTTAPGKDPDRLADDFESILAEASEWASRRRSRVILCLDGLDRLRKGSNLDWIPEIIPSNVQFIASSLDGAPLRAMKERGAASFPARALSGESVGTYVVSTLSERGRKLPPSEVERIAGHPQAMLPVFLKTLVEELSVFGSFAGLPDRITACLSARDTTELMAIVLDRIERDLGAEAVRPPLEAICASVGTMSEPELAEFCGMPIVRLSQLQVALGDLLYRRRGAVDFAHAHIRRAVRDRYAPWKSIHHFRLQRKLTDWWKTQPPGRRVARAIERHLAMAYSSELRHDIEHRGMPERQIRGEAAGEAFRCLTDPVIGALLLEHLDAGRLLALWKWWRVPAACDRSARR